MPYLLTAHSDIAAAIGVPHRAAAVPAAMALPVPMTVDVAAMVMPVMAIMPVPPAGAEFVSLLGFCRRRMLRLRGAARRVGSNRRRRECQRAKGSNDKGQFSHNVSSRVVVLSPRQSLDDDCGRVVSYSNFTLINKYLDDVICSEYEQPFINARPRMNATL